MSLKLGHQQYLSIAENCWIGIVLEEDSDQFLEDIVLKITRWGYPDNDCIARECYLYFIDLEAKCGLEFSTDEQDVDRHGNTVGFISVVRQDDGTSLTKIPYKIDRETGKIEAKLPRPLEYAQDVFNDLMSKIEQDYNREVRSCKKRDWGRDL